MPDLNIFRNGETVEKYGAWSPASVSSPPFPQLNASVDRCIRVRSPAQSAAEEPEQPWRKENPAPSSADCPKTTRLRSRIAPAVWLKLSANSFPGFTVPNQPAICAARLSTRRILLESRCREPANSAACPNRRLIRSGNFCGGVPNSSRPSGTLGLMVDLFGKTGKLWPCRIRPSGAPIRWRRSSVG